MIEQSARRAAEHSRPATIAPQPNCINAAEASPPAPKRLPAVQVTDHFAPRTKNSVFFASIDGAQMRMLSIMPVSSNDPKPM